MRGLDFAREAKKRKLSNVRTPFVIGAVISLGLCLDLTTSAGIAAGPGRSPEFGGTCRRR